MSARCERLSRAVDPVGSAATGAVSDDVSSAAASPAAATGTVSSEASSWVERAKACYELGKPNLSALVVVSAAMGVYVASNGAIDWRQLAHVIVGTWFSAFGAAGFNMVSERHVDGLMDRTRGRPIPSGRLTPRAGFLISAATGSIGILWLWFFVGALPAQLSLLTTFIYVLIYTPLKRRNGPLAIVVGAVPGATPTLLGWAAVQGELELGGWVLFTILFLWQFPHFLALAYLYRHDYEKAGLRFLPSEGKQNRTGLLIATGCVLVVMASLGLILTDLVGWIYAMGALAVGTLFAWRGARVLRSCTTESARSVFIASVTYLPLLFAFLVLDRLLS